MTTVYTIRMHRSLWWIPCKTYVYILCVYTHAHTNKKKQTHTHIHVRVLQRIRYNIYTYRIDSIICTFDRSSILFIARKENTTFPFLRTKFVSDCVSAAFIIHKLYAIKYSVRTFNSHSRGQRRTENSVENRKAVETLPLLHATRSVKMCNLNV